MLPKRLAVTNRWLPTRALMCIMMFTACWTSYTCRLQMPILAVPMIGKESHHSGPAACNADEVERFQAGEPHPDMAGGAAGSRYRFFRNPDEVVHELESKRARREDAPPQQQPVDGEAERVATREPRTTWDMSSNKRFDWSPDVRGQLLAAYSYGNCPGNLLGGIFSMYFGPRKMILWASLVSALLSLVSPLLANWGWGVLLASRVVIGLMGGVIFPACHMLVAKWAPPAEKGRFIWSLLGGTFGTIFTYPMVAAIADKINWEAAWYVPSLLMLAWLFCWFLFAYDSPLEHPGISEEERNYIINAQAGIVRGKNPPLKDTPIKQILTSVPFLCLVVCHFGNLFLLTFYQNEMIIYLSTVLGFQLSKGGLLASAPWIGRMVFGFFFSWAADVVRRRDILNLTNFRKCATIFSHLLPGLFLVGVGYAGCSHTLANVFLFLALGFNGAASIANLANNQDLSPNYAGFLYGIMNTIGMTSGMMVPPMVEAIAGKHGNTVEQWQIVFWIGSGVCALSMLVFIIGGSAKIQPWNEPNNVNDPKSARA